MPGLLLPSGCHDHLQLPRREVLWRKLWRVYILPGRQVAKYCANVFLQGVPGGESEQIATWILRYYGREQLIRRRCHVSSILMSCSGLLLSIRIHELQSVPGCVLLPCELGWLYRVCEGQILGSL